MDKPVHDRELGCTPVAASASFASVRGKGPAEQRRPGEEFTNLARVKSRTRCRRCKKKGHWKDDPECPLSGDQPRRDAAARDEINENSNELKRKQTGTVTFHMAHLPRSDLEDMPGPLVDDATPYSGMGYEEFLELQSVIMRN